MIAEKSFANRHGSDRLFRGRSRAPGDNSDLQVAVLLILPVMSRITYTSSEEVRAVFNTYVLPRVQSGEFSQLIRSSNAAHPNSG